MPLVAIIEGDRVESTGINPTEWVALKGSYRTQGLLMTCGQPGVPRTSSRGLQFFAHKPGAICRIHEGGPESPEHLRTKSIVAESARNLGWRATVESPASDRTWIADVLLELGERRLVVEAQWSSQSNTEFLRRQYRYLQADYECLWLTGPKNHNRIEGVPAERISGTAESISIELPVGTMGATIAIDLATGITHLLRGDIAPHMEAIATHLQLEMHMAKCWTKECAQWMTKWHISAVDLETRCGHVGTIEQTAYVPWKQSRVEESLQKIVRPEIIQIERMPAPTRYAWRTTKQVPQGYIAQICPHCNFVQGDIASEANSTVTWHTFAHRARFPFAPDDLAIPHLCVHAGNGRCTPEVPPAPHFPAELT